jgi:hypothetical protein
VGPNGERAPEQGREQGGLVGVLGVARGEGRETGGVLYRKNDGRTFCQRFSRVAPPGAISITARTGREKRDEVAGKDLARSTRRRASPQSRHGRERDSPARPRP